MINQERNRQIRIRGSEPPASASHPSRSESGSLEEDWLPAVLHSVDSPSRLTFRLLDYADAPPVVGRYEYYGEVKRGYPSPPLTTAAFAALTWPVGDAVTAETPLVFAMRNRRGDWILDAFTILEAAVPTGTYVFGGSAGSCKIRFMDSNDLYTPGAWIVRAPLGCPTRWLHAGVTVAGAIYSLGGSYTLDDSLVVNDRYMPDGWVKRMSMPPPTRRDLAAFELDGKACVAGGTYFFSPVVQFRAVNDVDEYNPANDTWAGETPSQRTTPDALGTARFRHTAFGLEGAGYVCAGQAHPLYLRSTEKFANGTWTVVSPLLGAVRAHLASFTLGGFGFVIAGAPFDSQFMADVERYNPVTDRWEGRAAMPNAVTGRAMHVASSIGEYGYVFGGYDGNELNDMRRYNPTGNSWSGAGMASPPRRHAAGATL